MRGKVVWIFADPTRRRKAEDDGDQVDRPKIMIGAVKQ
jgi:hypothetical protein